LEEIQKIPSLKTPLYQILWQTPENFIRRLNKRGYLSYRYYRERKVAFFEIVKIHWDYEKIPVDKAWSQA